MTVSLLDRTALNKLKRHDLQQVARRERLKANGKSSDIIDGLLAKYPDGVPRRQTSHPRKGKPQSKISPKIKPEPENVEPAETVTPQLKRQKFDIGSAGASSRLPRLPSTPLSERFAATWIESVAVAIGQPTPAACSSQPELSPPPPPGYKDVRFVRRELVDLVNNSVTIQAEVTEAEALLKRAALMYNEVSLDFREMACIRRTIEGSFVAKMKEDRTLWDGTFMMKNDEDKDAWEAYVRDVREHKAKQKELNEKREAAKLAAESAAYEREQAAARSQPPAEPVTGLKRKRPVDATEVLSTFPVVFTRANIAKHCLNGSQRFYTQSASPPPPKKPAPPAQGNHLPHVDGHNVRHEVHEGSAALSVPFNPPGGGAGPGVGGSSVFPITSWPMLDAALTTIVGLAMVFGGGVGYVAWYKKRVLDKIEDAFAPGYDPALELATHQTKRRPTEGESGELVFDEDAPWTENLRRKEQDTIDRIVQGQEPGHYFVLLGPKGSGKGTMIFDSMTACQAEGIAMCEAHPDLEVFRLRLGKALNYEFHEDSQTGLFQRRDPKEGGPALDIERAMNKLEKVALRSARKTGRPLVLIINNIHFFNNDEQGRNMILQLQQKAEAWAASGILTMVFSSDDFWPFHIMRKTASRMHVLSIYDLDTKEALHAANRMRVNSKRPLASPEEVKEAVSLVGGRLSFLNRVAKAKDMVGMANHLKSVEKAWLLSQIGLIPDCDDDVMDEQKWSSCSWLLLQEFVKIRAEQEAAREAAIAAGEAVDDEPLPLPVIPYWRCRQIMTRADFMEELDRLNVIAIDIHHDVRPDSMLTLHAAHEVVGEEGFEELLENVRDRIDEIESLHRTRELTFKDVDQGDRIYVTVDKGGGNIVGGRIPVRLKRIAENGNALITGVPGNQRSNLYSLQPMGIAISVL
ncbi:hypothetical protein LshimejAT787_0407880 [Lyophyllum shimeji]|uniref:AAA protein C-terminal winged helix domain-containing protein n=1 Tax=Lyophyllum shimeji TaxID=47721 RepID=A0A9P3ULW1_LYOSH|nr:hypothetical protein LshimejAT787_0407880 [Lyophyllum shimeji]